MRGLDHAGLFLLISQTFLILNQSYFLLYCSALSFSTRDLVLNSLAETKLKKQAHRTHFMGLDVASWIDMQECIRHSLREAGIKPLNIQIQESLLAVLQLV